jgi:arylsulfatase
MVSLWWAEASKNNALPLDWRGAERFSSALSGKPNLAGDRKRFVYYGTFSGLPEASAPDLKNKSFNITATVDVMNNANGMIFTQGGNTGGWAFYMKAGKLVGVHNYLDSKYFIVRSDSMVPAGKHELKMGFTYNGGNQIGKDGIINLFVDDQRVGCGKVDQTTPLKYSLSENQDIGIDTGTPVTYDYTEPFVFEGTLEQVIVELDK